MLKFARSIVFVCVLAVLLGIVHIASADGQSWSLFGPAAFKVEDLKSGFIAEGSDLYTNFQWEGAQLRIYDTQNPICILQYGVETVYEAGVDVTIEGKTLEDGFRVIDSKFWFGLPSQDGAYDLCWRRQQIYLPLVLR